MSDSTFKFTEVRMHTPSDNLMAAIGIVQSLVLASDHDWNPEIVFGRDHFYKSHPLQAVLAMLMPLLAPIDDADWEG
ncbi:hypothetical protein [Pseudogemmobacter bohemicus]|uniref:hypothetical protein n=1 Tax=Pseudogemmobacter bohemicus TaxID=2250708 RepID=UPI000DD4462F|nr:hypothetical protein [Pseudogemmobacter bohemicus]